MNKKIILSFIFGIILLGVLFTPKTFATSNTIYGDVNCDGVVDSSDSLTVLRYTKKLEKLTDYQVELADVNGDRKINKTDADLILKKSVELIKIFPTEIKSYGDVNTDGKINLKDVTALHQYLVGKRNLTKQQLIFADVDGDGKVTFTDLDLIRQQIVNNITFFPVQIKYGDINLDNNLDYSDYILLCQYCEGKATLSEEQLKIADINKDNKVNFADVRAAKKIADIRE